MLLNALVKVQQRDIKNVNSLKPLFDLAKIAYVFSPAIL